MSVQDETAAPTAAADHLQQIAVHVQAATLAGNLIPQGRVAVHETVRYECECVAPDGSLERYWHDFLVPPQR